MALFFSGLPWAWGSTFGAETPESPDSRAGAQRRLATRAVATGADPETLFLWLCQLRRAPYSYDWIDNFGRRSPRTPDPSATNLEIGQDVMTIFELAGFEPNRSLTISMKPGWPTRLFGAIAVRYAIIPTGRGRVLLRGDLSMPPAGRVLGRPRRYLLAWGDLIMMRKQLRTLSSLAEGLTARPGTAAPDAAATE
ncbi:SRPBCC family protein [Zhihengliuella alba]|uniref:SRPBCC family protein n=1 Tax=Zhihengliuella alba TaxID=547018 RepID=UPI0031F19AD2